MRAPYQSYFGFDDRVIPSHFPRLLVEVAAEQCADRAALLQGTRMTEAMLESPDSRLTLRQYTRLCRNALRLTDNPGLGIDLGQRVRPTNLGMLGLATMSSPDARTAIELGLKYYRLLAPFWDLSLELSGDIARVVVREAMPLKEHLIFATEIALVSWVNVARAVVGGDLHLIAFEFSYPAPPHARRYAEFADVPMRFDQSVTQVLLQASALERKLPSGDPASMRAAERLCEAGLASIASSEPLTARVRRLLEASPGEYPGLHEVAKTLGTSERTLRRDLDDMGASYQSLLDIARCRHATDLLIGTDTSINDIAGHLGFSEGRAFRRAFKRWTGRTATKYRLEQRQRDVDRR